MYALKSYCYISVKTQFFFFFTKAEHVMCVVMVTNTICTTHIHACTCTCYQEILCVHMYMLTPSSSLPSLSLSSILYYALPTLRMLLSHYINWKPSWRAQCTTIELSTREPLPLTQGLHWTTDQQNTHSPLFTLHSLLPLAIIIMSWCDLNS